MALQDLSQERRRRLTHRTVPLAAVAAALLVLVVLVAGSCGASDEESAGARFAAAWERSDWAAMHRELTPGAQRRHPPADLQRAYGAAAATATATAVDAGRARGDGDAAVVDVTLRTRVFGAVRGELRLPMEDARVDWAPHHAFPGLREGERLTRQSDPPRRADILARDGTKIASGPARGRTVAPGPAAGIAGQLKPAAAGPAREAVYARGFPRDWPAGADGLERIVEDRVAGVPGGTLLAGTRRVAAARPRPARAVRTTIDPELQAAAVTALAGRFGGIVALDARRAEVRALAGVAFSAPQPPGSTFKIVTASAALEARQVKPSTKFPVATSANIDGVQLQNANGESCGGSFENSFVHSCNSVFAPVGVRVGAGKLVEMAERYGFNRPPELPGAAPSTLPAAEAVGSDLAVGSTAIGQGKVLATPLTMALIAHTVANGGVKRTPTLVRGDPAGRPNRVISARTARTLRRFMVGVVRGGTGTAAAIPGTTVAGKTGTAELGSTQGPTGEDAGASDTDAWFTAFAPARKPRLAVAVMLVKAGAGGATAAPAARVVLQAGLGR
ncbi:MAG TPA: penicillin-binding transpeptidase domain-containing protein [Thermoleophilaceae bacterium]